jgi:hypothetical protein
MNENPGVSTCLQGKIQFFFWEEKLVVPLIATPNIDECKRR